MGKKLTVAGAALLVASLATLSAAADPWDFYGGAGTVIGYARNPRLTGTSLSSTDTMTGSLYARFGVRRDWVTTRFDLSYSPRATVYRQDPGLNNDTHRLRSTWRHDYSTRSRLLLSQDFLYTPEEAVDPNVASNAPVLNSTDRGFSNFQGRYTFQKSARTTLNVNYRYNNRTFSSDEFFDSSNHGAGVIWTRQMTQRHSVNAGYNYSIFSFRGRSVVDLNTGMLVKLPGSQVQTAGAGYSFSSQKGFSIGLNAGYNVIYSDDPDIEPQGSQVFAGRIAWNGIRTDLNAISRRRFDNATGSRNNTENWNTLGSARFVFSQTVTGGINTNYNVNERLSLTGTTTGDKLRTFSANANITWMFTQSWNTFLSYTYYRQSDSGQVNAPTGRSQRYAVGLNWSFQ